MQNINLLIEELNTGRKEIKTDSFSMSIGEIINLYKDGDLELAPAYQRLFRWDDQQKSKFIESILLGIPLPPIFVAQKENSKWSVVDGLQRLSTILQLTGELQYKDQATGETKKKEPLKLTTTKKLPSLENFTWETLTDDIKRTLKRAKFSINIILTENSIQAQYELFQRLNTGGLHLEAQEIRNCLIIMLDEDFYNKLDELKSYPAFKNSLNLQEGKFNIEYHMELILRFFIAKHNNIDFSTYRTSTLLLSDFIDNETIKLISDDDFNLDQEIQIFKRTFDFLYKSLGHDVFKKYNTDKNEFERAFSNSSFEAIASGVALNIDKIEDQNVEEFIQKIKSMYSNDDFLEFSKRGNKAIYRMKSMIDFSKEYFKI
ncbi:DUF262 domain-containing protein [Flavobacterium johnsoniae]|uniref:DUF262 domain-containing protein n=1 Tax=Flavobacterium johnsoniae TaxID=986 RepID=UPI0009FB6240|nr:DUF262 domain-containing protein [Flavobacterium johnsoniae]